MASGSGEVGAVFDLISDVYSMDLSVQRLEEMSLWRPGRRHRGEAMISDPSYGFSIWCFTCFLASSYVAGLRVQSFFTSLGALSLKEFHDGSYAMTEKV